MFSVHSDCVYPLNGKIKHIKHIITYLEAHYTSKVSAVYANASFGFETDITYLACIHVQYKGSHCSIRLMFLGFVCYRTGSHDHTAQVSLCCSQQFMSDQGRSVGSLRLIRNKNRLQMKHYQLKASIISFFYINNGSNHKSTENYHLTLRLSSVPLSPSFSSKLCCSDSAALFSQLYFQLQQTIQLKTHCFLPAQHQTTD